MVRQLEHSLPGKRKWSLDNVTGIPDYSDTIRSTFPDWSKFFYVKTPKRLRSSYLNVDSNKPYEDGFYNGNTRELIGLLTRSYDGYLSNSPRVRSAWNISVSGFFDYIYEFEMEYGEKYFNEVLM